MPMQQTNKQTNYTCHIPPVDTKDCLREVSTPPPLALPISLVLLLLLFNFFFRLGFRDFFVCAATPVSGIVIILGLRDSGFRFKLLPAGLDFLGVQELAMD